MGSVNGKCLTKTKGLKKSLNAFINTCRRGNEMMAKKSLLDYQREYERIIHADQPRKDILLAGLMTEMEKQFKIPVQRNIEWERENIKVLAMYRKLSITRTL